MPLTLTLRIGNKEKNGKYLKNMQSGQRRNQLKVMDKDRVVLKEINTIKKKSST
jgi:hypothetical protein